MIIVGAALIMLVFVAIFVMIAYSLGFWKAVGIVVISIVVTGIVITGALMMAYGAQNA